MHSLFDLVCALTRDGTCNLGVSGDYLNLDFFFFKGSCEFTRQSYRERKRRKLFWVVYKIASHLRFDSHSISFKQENYMIKGNHIRKIFNCRGSENNAFFKD